MPLPAQVISHGEDFFQCAPERWLERARSVDAFETAWMAPTREEPTLAIGAPAPGHPYMRIVQARREQDSPNAWYHALTCEGIAGNTDFKELSRVDTQPEEGFDETRLTIYTRSPDDVRWRKGSRLTRSVTDPTPPVGFESMYIIDRAKVWSEADGYFELPLTLKGVIGTKLGKRRTSTSSESTSSKFNGFTILTGDMFTGYPPVDSGLNATLSGTSLDVEYDSPAVTVTDSIVTTTEPPTDFLGRFWSPTDPPDVSYLTLSGTGVKYFFPFGWKCTDLVTEKLTGVDVWLVQVSWTYQRITVPTA